MRTAIPSRAIWLAAAALASATAACADLTPIPSGECGNAVIDPGEDCDTHATEPGVVCAASGAPNACRYTCAGEGTARTPCPMGWGCGSDRLCRVGSGSFAPLGAAVPFPALQQIRVGDLDGNGVTEILALGKDDAVGRRSARVIHPADGVTSTLAVPGLMALPALGVIDLDGTVDVVFADLGGVAIFRGQREHQAEFASFPSLFFPTGTSLAVVALDVIPALSGDEILTIVDRQAAGATLERPAGALPGAVLTPLPGGKAALAGPVAVGRFDEAAPCAQLVFPYLASTELLVFTPCRVAPKQTVDWNIGGVPSVVALPAGAKIAGNVLVVDLDLDGHLDLLFSADVGAFVAWGVGNGTFVSAKQGGTAGAAGPYDLPATAKNGGFPLAAADLNADGKIDFVFPGGLVVSSGAEYALVHANEGAPWTQAVIADFNANGLLDVIAGSPAVLDLDFFNNAGGGVFNPATVVTDRPPQHLAAGDFDGDLVDDVAFSAELITGAVRSDLVTIAFGSAHGPPSNLTVVAHLEEIEQLSVARLADGAEADGIDDLVTVSRGAVSKADSLFTLRGGASRTMSAPLPLDTATGRSLPVALTIGHFGADRPDIAALGADMKTGELRLWHVEATAAEVSSNQSVPSAPLAAAFHPGEGSSLISFRYGALAAAGDLDGTGPDEVVLVAPHGTAKDEAAVVVAHYQPTTFTFVLEAERPLTARVTDDSALLLRDLDGDGHLDALILTGSDEEPGELLVLWGDGAGGLGVDAPEHIAIDGGATGVTCLPSLTPRGCDLIFTSPTATFRAAARADRSFALTPIDGLGGANDVAAGDFDRDGVIDLALAVNGALQLHRGVPVHP